MLGQQEILLEFSHRTSLTAEQCKTSMFL
uniref:Uncharacterized protein n=1 Tax=Arundo donax TaxID=35708 RepID=A0A0A9FI06_ARUDO